MRRTSKGSLLSSFRCALEGLWFIVSTERNARIHLIAAVVVILLSTWLRLTAIEWALMIAAIALVFAGEMLNTVVELTIDMITLEDHPLARRAKDVAAGAILVAAMAAAVMGFIILGPRLWQKLAL
ncbi:MAG TPA: diacylglycerol kinase family protein [Chloroflexi bacterium]|nr:diacylglycerol kinase family protein [Chloroflexota bacterium]